MKKSIICFAVITAAISFTSCVKENFEPKNAARAGKSIVFEGEFAPSTKVQFADAVDGIHSLNWSKGDAIGIFTYIGATENNNIQALLHDEAAGASKGIFIPQDEVIVIPPTEEGGESTEGLITIQYPESEDEKFFVYYPYKKGVTINPDDFQLHFNVEAEQFQATVGDRKVCANGIATAIADVVGGTNKATFSLTHNLAYISVKATSSEFVGYRYHSVVMYDKKGTATLSGQCTIDPMTGVVTAVDGATKPSVRVDVSHHDFSNNPERNELYLAVIPGDYTAADMAFVVTFINADGATKTIPVEFEKACKFPAGSITTIDLGEISSSMNTYEWFEESETRDLLRRCAYGSQNTYFAERPEYVNGGEVTTLTFEVKARGDFSLVREPKYYSLLAPSEAGDPTYSEGVRSFLSLTGEKTPDATQSGYRTQTYLPISSDYTVTVYVLDQKLATGRWGSVAIYDKDHNVIWSFMVQGYKAGDAPQDVVYPGFKLLDRFLGQGNSMRKAEADGDLDFNMPAYFQWGRKDPFVWSNNNASCYYVKGDQKLADIADHAAVPTTRIMTYDNWYEGKVRYDLWGGENNADDWYDPNAKGHKTVYDPCPEGYRVPDAKVFKEVGDKAEIWEVVNSDKNQVTDPEKDGYYINPDSPFTAKGNSVLAYKLPDNTYDYWSFSGFMSNGGNASDTYNSRTRGNNNRSMCLETWANSSPANSISRGASRGVTLEYGYWSERRIFNQRHDALMCYAYTIRCQKIE